MKVILDSPFDIVSVNIYEIATKKIVFTGSIRDAARFMDVHPTSLQYALKQKSKIKKRKYAVRYVSLKETK